MHRRVTLRRIFTEHLLADRFQVRRDRWSKLAQRWRSLDQDLLQHLVDRPSKRSTAGKHLIQNYAQTVDVTSWSHLIGPSANLLRRHIKRRTKEFRPASE